MAEKKRIDFCTKCRKETEYSELSQSDNEELKTVGRTSLTKKGIVQTIEGRDYCFFVTTAICKECGAMMSPPGLIDQNVREVEEQYQAMQERW
jgi:hypothetical protein